MTNRTWTIVENLAFSIVVVDDVDHHGRTGLIAQAGDERTSVPLSAPTIAALVEALLAANPGARELAVALLEADQGEVPA